MHKSEPCPSQASVEPTHRFRRDGNFASKVGIRPEDLVSGCSRLRPPTAVWIIQSVHVDMVGSIRRWGSPGNRNHAEHRPYTHHPIIAPIVHSLPEWHAHLTWPDWLAGFHLIVLPISATWTIQSTTCKTETYMRKIPLASVRHVSE